MAVGRRASAAGSGRLHVVLIPGFAGFDALGQMEYYAGVTPVFCAWKTGKARRPAVLHYFDNFPTAAVSTRAGRLQRFLVKRIARGEFVKGDHVALVGHSTGGLDIRRLVYDLAKNPDSAIAVDGSAPITAEELLGYLRRVVFLSVPHWGTNIAAWVRDNLVGRAIVLAELRAAVGASQVPLVRRVQDWLADKTAAIVNLDLFDAIRDALSEAQAGASDDPIRVATAHEASAALELWLRHMAWDFRALDDLTPPPRRAATARDGASPAQFGAAEREWEMTQWRAWKIQTRSYATAGTRPFRFAGNQPASQWEILKAWTWPELTPREGDGSGTDAAYRFCYRACAGGPFALPESAGFAAVKRPIEVWDNDGIVNTASMFWPDGETVLIDADHMDIVGHYAPVKTGDEDAGRRYRAYDLLGSGAGFDKAAFAKVWEDVFDFCSAAGNRKSQVPFRVRARPRSVPPERRPSVSPAVER